MGTPSCYDMIWYDIICYDMIWYDMIPDNVIWCQWIICCTIWCSLVFIYLLVFDIHIDYLTWPYYHLINEYRLKKWTADFVTGSWSISPKWIISLDRTLDPSHFKSQLKLPNMNVVYCMFTILNKTLVNICLLLEFESEDLYTDITSYYIW